MNVYRVKEHDTQRTIHLYQVEAASEAEAIEKVEQGHVDNYDVDFGDYLGPARFEVDLLESTTPASDALESAKDKLREALRLATTCGLLDQLAADIHPDAINAFCDAVGYDERQPA